MSIPELWQYSESEDKEDRAFALAYLSLRIGESGDYTTAISTGISGTQLFAELGNDFMEGVTNYYTGLAHSAAGEYEAGIEAFNRAAHLYRSTHNEKQMGDVIIAKARCLEHLGRNDEAIEAFFEAQKFFESAEHWSMSGVALIEAGEIYGAIGKESEALKVFQQALYGFRLVGDMVGAGNAHDRIAAALIDLGQRGEALENLHEAYNIFEYISDGPKKTYAEYRLGWTLVTNGDNAEALQYLESSSASYKEMHDFGRAARADVQLSLAHRSLGNVELANEILEKSTTIFRSLNMTHEALINEINSAVYMRVYDLDYAVQRFRRLLDETSALGSKYLWNSTVIRLAESLNMKDDKESHEESLSLIESIDLSTIGEEYTTYSRYLNAYSESLYLNGRREEAKFACQKLIDLSVSESLTFETAEAYRLLGYIAKDAGDESYADHFSRAVALYLSAGLVEDAKSLSSWFLPQSSRRQDTLYSDEADELDSDFDTLSD